METRTEKFEQVVKTLAEDMANEIQKYLDSMIDLYPFTLKPVAIKYDEGTGELIDVYAEIDEFYFPEFEGSVTKVSDTIVEFAKDGYKTTVQFDAIYNRGVRINTKPFDISYYNLATQLDDLKAELYNAVDSFAELNLYNETIKDIQTTLDYMGYNVNIITMSEDHTYYKTYNRIPWQFMDDDANKYCKLSFNFPEGTYTTTIKDVYNIKYKNLYQNINNWRKNHRIA